MFLIDDEYIKNSISTYKATRSAITLKEINEHLSRYIYNYPRKAFGVNHESALDFYCYYMERIENIILKYNETEVKFITWFTYTLRNSYLNYIDYKKRKEKYNNIEEVSIDAPLCNREAYTLHDVLYDTKTYSLSDYVDDADDIESISLKMFNYIESIFNERDSLTFFMHNLELFINIVSKPLMNYFNISYEEAMGKYHQIKDFYYEARQRHYDNVDKSLIPALNAHLYGDVLVYFNRSISNLVNIVESITGKDK